MDNGFYTDFDTVQFDGGGGDGDREGTRGKRTPFEQDRDRIIHSFAFRRLQAKTQVFLSGEYDFYRTRLTHSIEVAQIGRAICAHLRRSGGLLGEDFYVDEHLVEAACLAHDIGHPPFGHAGERTLNDLMAEHGGFEGNAQTLRTLTDTLYGSGGHRQGMKPTRALMDAVLKYKTLRGVHPSSTAKSPSPPKNHFLYEDQKSSLYFVFDGVAFPNDLKPGDTLDGLKSIECQIMDWSDDTAFSINDTMDGIRAGFITVDRLTRWRDEAEQVDADPPFTSEDGQLIDELVKAMKGGEAERFLSKRIGDFVTGCRVVKKEGFMADRTNRYGYGIEIDPDVEAQRMLLKRIATDLMFRNPRVLQLEKKGGWMLERLFDALSKHYSVRSSKTSPLLPLDVHDSLVSVADDTKSTRLLCDYVAGMTDGYATRTYKRLFDPDFGSFVDLV